MQLMKILLLRQFMLVVVLINTTEKHLILIKYGLVVAKLHCISQSKLVIISLFSAVA